MSKAMILQDDQGNVYPRVIPLPEGLEFLADRWEVRETLYQSGKGEGLPYTRYFTKEGCVPSHGGVLSGAAAIKLDAADQGYDAAAAYQAFKDASVACRDRKSSERLKEREALGIVKGEQRELAISAFHEKYDKLTGPIVQAFPGWSCRWHFLVSCNQTHVTYTDSTGKDWVLLKDIEAFLGTRVLNGEDLSAFIEAGRAGQDSALFGEGAKRAKADGGTESISAKRGRGKPASSVQDVEEVQEVQDDDAVIADWADLGDLGVEEIQAFFLGLKLEQYVSAVEELGIDGVTLQQMCRTDSLEDMGITNRIHQHRIRGHLHPDGLQKLRQLCTASRKLGASSASSPSKRQRTTLDGPSVEALGPARIAHRLRALSGAVGVSPAGEAEARQLCRVRGRTKARSSREPSPRDGRDRSAAAAADHAARSAAASAGHAARRARKAAATGRPTRSYQWSYQRQRWYLGKHLLSVEDLTEGEVAVEAPAADDEARPVPGAYPMSYTVVLETGLVVQEGVHLETRHVGKLPCGAVIDVQEAVAFQDRIRGRIEHLLAGWISLSSISTGLVCAERIVSDKPRVDGGDSGSGGDEGAEEVEEPEPELRTAKAAGIARGSCAAGHPLERHLVDQPGWKCNSCGADQPVGVSMWGCRTCDFDKCASCHVGPPTEVQEVRPEAQVVELDDD